jgi:glycerol-3-phosphate acyltransferase PlsY
LVDVLKGFLSITLVRVVILLPGVANIVPPNLDLTRWHPWLITVAALIAILGHSKSIWIGFTGGKSAATGLGVFLGLAWPVGLGALLTFCTMLALFRFVSLSSISAALVGFVLMLVFQEPVPFQLMAAIGGLYVTLRHRSNIQRLLSGEEPRIGQKVQPE